jgi:hypothetical protein
VTAPGCGSSGSGPRGETGGEGAGGQGEQFGSRGGDTSIQRYGARAPEPERDEAESALRAYLDARAAADWPAACRQLSKTVIAQLARYPSPGGSQGKRCDQVLPGLFRSVTDSVLREAAVVEVGPFRVAGKRGFLLYHGTDVDHFMPMQREAGSWKVAAVSASPLP